MSAESFFWRKSSHSGNNGGNCVEVSRRPAFPLPGHADDPLTVAVRDSKNRHGAVLTLSGPVWEKLRGRLAGG
ncbi:uncharacterized protein DUF397 [Actinocorallia herbida]|uniref:Uncharacterized protein DUF397 n=1 Tax=Actinocorallia herbida TaxID=58109 RepID=A0A3N1D1H8_9ACTN|nr:DUF397 domain-containing protein [Actinocorallia herbida]ROO87366.1 uncharacterized protein DUF397 [Actinocorallia herbida]